MKFEMVFLSLPDGSERCRWKILPSLSETLLLIDERAFDASSRIAWVLNNLWPEYQANQLQLSQNYVCADRGVR